MFFYLKGIKDISDKNYTLEVLIEGENINMIKRFLSQEKIIVLGLDPYKEEISVFGDVYIDIDYHGQKIRIIGNYPILEDFLNYIIKLNLTIVDANYLLSPIPFQEVKSLISTAIEREKQYQEQLKNKQLQEEKKKNISFNDSKLKKSYLAIDQIINQLDQLVSIGGTTISPATLKKISETKGAISKLRLATNYDKIIEELHKAMDLIVTTQDFLLSQLEKNKVFFIVPGSSVLNTDVIREQTKLAKAKLLSALGAHLSQEETLYSTLGYMKLFSQYLKKDFQASLEHKLLFYKHTFLFLELLGIFLLIEVVVFSVYANAFGITIPLPRFGIFYIYLSVWCLLLHFLNEKFVFKKASHYLYAFGLTILLYVGILLFLKFILIF